MVDHSEPSIPFKVNINWGTGSTGWICPKCHHGVAPHIVRCPCATPLFSYPAPTLGGSSG